MFKKGNLCLLFLLLIMMLLTGCSKDKDNNASDADKERYDTTFGIYYPPDFYLRGDFSNPNKIVINDLYHHTESPSEIEDSTWVFGTYNKIN